MPGLVPGIHVFLALLQQAKTWMAGTRPGHDVESLLIMTRIGIAG
jgi:hypothetical protein